ncbi:hypothetical protein SBRCBS47491_005438 [Sporothrix bragantina]|uniref:Uncharacterized protein n=1 Tax=Sporothrix bragantina TaxID=671064 RepID=A0ABP0BYF3_9PEZI
MTSLLYFFRNQRVLPSVETNEPPTEDTPSPAKAMPDSPSSFESSSSPSMDSMASIAMSATPSPPQRLLMNIDEAGDNNGLLKRKASGPLDSGRTSAFVSKRWKTLNRPMDPGGPGQRAREIRQPVSVADRVNGAVASTSAKKTNWSSRFNPLRLVKVKQEEDDEDDAVAKGLIVVARSEYDLIMARQNREIPDSQETVDIEMATEAVNGGDVTLPTAIEGKEEEDDGDDEEDEMDYEDTEEDEKEEADDGDDSGLYDPALSGKVYPYPGLPQRVQSFKGSSLDTSIEQPVLDSDDYDDSDDSLEDEEDGVEENWDWLFEAEPDTVNDMNRSTAVEAPDNDYYWSVVEDERMAYEEGIAAIEDYESWTSDEKRLHRLLSLRGFHPLLPATWTRDFLGVPMYPSLFSPIDADDTMNDSNSSPPVTIANYGSQFHATKALRALFDLQSRVSGLRQTGHNTARIGAIIERELRRYIAWAATDAGLDRCAPFAAMPNIAAKQFVVRSNEKTDRKGKKTKKRSVAHQVQDFFGDWVTRYRTYYASLPGYAVEGGDGSQKQRLRPPRLLYGFVIVQHAVMLLVVDAAGNRSSRHPRPRCLADFNLSLGDRWLDASLSVAIPVHVARAAQLRCQQGLVLPTTSLDSADEDA